MSQASHENWIQINSNFKQHFNFSMHVLNFKLEFQYNCKLINKYKLLIKFEI
jgi:hypothetical protein